MSKKSLRLTAVRLPAVFWDELKQIAEGEYTTPSAIIRRALSDYLKKKEAEKTREGERSDTFNS
jgi:predicted DNA-binding ribbon-helix-helix protein